MLRRQHLDLWLLSILLIVLVPPCGCLSTLCLFLARRSRRRSGSTNTSNCLELTSYASVVTALCFLLAVSHFAKWRMFQTHLLSSNCSTSSVGNDTTIRPSPERSTVLPQFPMNLTDSAIKQRFVSNDPCVLQSSVDVEHYVVGRDINVLPSVPNEHRVSSYAPSEP